MALDEIDPRNLLRDPKGPIGGDTNSRMIDREPHYPVISVAYLPRAAKGAAFPLLESCIMSPFQPAHLKVAAGNGRGNAYTILHGVAVHAKYQLNEQALDPNLVAAVLDALQLGRAKAKGQM